MRDNKDLNQVTVRKLMEEVSDSKIYCFQFLLLWGWGK